MKQSFDAVNVSHSQAIGNDFIFEYNRMNHTIEIEKRRHQILTPCQKLCELSVWSWQINALTAPVYTKKIPDEKQLISWGEYYQCEWKK